MSLALFVIRAAEASKVREKGFQLMESLLLIHRIPWDKAEGGEGGEGHITPKAIIDVSAYILLTHCTATVHHSHHSLTALSSPPCVTVLV